MSYYGYTQTTQAFYMIPFSGYAASQYSKQPHWGGGSYHGPQPSPHQMPCEPAYAGSFRRPFNPFYCEFGPSAVCDFYGGNQSPVSIKHPSTPSPKPTPEPVTPTKATIIQDKTGTTIRNYQAVELRNIRFIGDDGKNSFNLGGKNNRFEVANLGADDRVTLTGAQADWQRLTDDNPNDGIVTLKNATTGTTVTLKTDNSRKDTLIKDRLRFAS
jgi:hypothetical protein